MIYAYVIKYWIRNEWFSYFKDMDDMLCLSTVCKSPSYNISNSLFIIKNTRLIFWIQHKHRLSNIRKGQLLNIFLSFAMPCFTSLLEGWMPSCVSVLVLSINQTAQQVSCVKNGVIRDEFTHLFFYFNQLSLSKRW